MSAVVALLTRSPSDPRIKARMAPVVPDYPQRRELILAFIDDLLARLATVDGAAVKVAVTAPIEGFRIARPWVPWHQLLAQRGDPFGDRLRHVFEDLAVAGFKQIVVLGADVPDVPVSVIEHTIEMLRVDPQRVITGPSPGGSFYLLGATAVDHKVPDLTTGVRWGSPQMLDDIEALAQSQGHEVIRVADWHDVDTAEDVQELVERLRANPSGAPHTAETLRSIALLS